MVTVQKMRDLTDNLTLLFGTKFFSVENAAAKLNMSERDLRTYLRWLEKKGLAVTRYFPAIDMTMWAIKSNE